MAKRAKALNVAEPSSKRYDKLARLLIEIYGAEIAASSLPRYIELIQTANVTPKTHTVSQKDIVLIAYPDHLNHADEPSLRTLYRFVSTYLKKYVDTVHILPFYPSTSDDGFAVNDYSGVATAFGSWDDIGQFESEFRLMVDGVLNHTSASHPWFKKFLAGDPQYENYYITLDEGTDVSSVTRPRTNPLLTAFKTPTGKKYVWTTFSADQVDLNYANPTVLYDMLGVLLGYVRRGADLIRFDAIAYVWKELGTNSISHPKTHALMKFMREAMDLAAPWVWLVTETNVPHLENISYFGNGHDEARMVYDFALPPLIVHTLQTGTADTLTKWAQTLHAPSDATYFFHFTASHDGIGLRGANGILSEEALADMCVRVKERGGYLSMKANSDGTESVYEMNISYFDAVTDPNKQQTTQIDQFICSQAIALALRGVPGIYLHSILGSRSWHEGALASGEYRTINRQKLMATDIEHELEDPHSMHGEVFKRYLHLLDVRRQEPAFSPLTTQTILDLDERVVAIMRSADQDELLALHNVSDQTVTLAVENEWRDLLKDARYINEVSLRPYEVVWAKRVG